MKKTNKVKNIKTSKANVWKKLDKYKNPKVELIRWDENEREEYDIELKKIQDELAIALKLKDSPEKDAAIRKANAKVEAIEYLKPKQATMTVVLNPLREDIMVASRAARKVLGLVSIGDNKGKSKEEIELIEAAQPEVDDAYLNLLANACMVAQCLVEGPPLEGNTLGEKGQSVFDYFSDREITKLSAAIYTRDFVNFI